jgi:hypothetical protein
MPTLLRRTRSKHLQGEGLPEQIIDDVKEHPYFFYEKLGRFFGVLVLFAALFIFATGGKPREGVNSYVVKKTAITSPGEIIVPDLSAFEGCTVSWVPPPPKLKDFDTRPVWVPSFPNSGSAGPGKLNNIVDPLINAVTGLATGTKSYHLSSKILKRCKGRTETAACTNSHPATPITPEKQTANFHPKFMLVIRNFKTAFAANYYDKAIQYHGQKGQVAENDWREFRDDWFKKSIQAWKKIVFEWKKMDDYKIGMYIPYEKLLDVEEGPKITQRMADEFRAAGFNVPPKEDIPCMWYQTVKDEWTMSKDFLKYIPGYTLQQRDLFLFELELFMKEVADDAILVAILKDYYADTRDNTRIDKPCDNRTASK